MDEVINVLYEKSKKSAYVNVLLGLTVFVIL